MARSDFKTWLSLDRWCEIMGLHPLAFNSLQSNTYMKNNVCGEITYQNSWQHSDRVGRDDIAMAIQISETKISQYVGFNLMPDWTQDERLQYPQPGVPGMYNVFGTNPRGMMKSLELRKGHIICGGQRAKTLIQRAVAITRSDADGDGYQETATVSCVTTVTNKNEIHIYYTAKEGADGWEIRPITVGISGGTATITFKIWQVPAWQKLEYLDVDPLDADLAASYETTVDVYRVYNDPSVQVQLMWENTPADCCNTCYACQFGTQYGCFHNRDPRLGYVVPAAGSWNASTQEFDAAEFDACREPDQCRFWYYSGWLDYDLPRPYAMLSPKWEYAIAYLAASLLDRPVCGCSNVSEFIARWRRDASFTSQEEGGFTVTAEQATNKLGTTMGALFAYRMCNLPGIRVRK